MLRAQVRDSRSPLAYGYSDTLEVYFNQSPLFQVDTSSIRGSEQQRDSSYMADLVRMRPRIIVRFNPRPDSLLYSGLMDGASELAGRPGLVDVPVGRGHVVLFAFRPFWRWETQGSFGFGWNALLNWNDLDAGRPRR